MQYFIEILRCFIYSYIKYNKPIYSFKAEFNYKHKFQVYYIDLIKMEI